MDHGCGIDDSVGGMGPNGSGSCGMSIQGLSHEGLGSPPPAKMRKGEGPRVELRFLIASKVAGVIIGRGGQSIKKLREDYAARVSIPDSNGPERIMLLEGDLGTLMAMLEEILPRMDESQDFGYQSGRDRSMNMDDGGVDLRMLVHQSQIGCIIGRGGFNIRDLREKLPLRLLKVHPSVCPSSTDRVVQMVGPAEVVLQCVQKISEMLETSPPKGPRNNYNARGFGDYSAGEYGGYQSSPNDGMPVGGGGGGGMGMGGGGGGGSMMGGRGGNGGRGGMGPGGMGSGSGMRGSMDMGMHGGPMGDFGGPPGAVGGNPFGGGGPSGPGMGGPGGHVPPSEMTTTQVSLPDKLTGSIMGRGGARINQIRQQSCAEITINPQEPGSSDRIITIRGSTEQIQKAQFLMQFCVKRFSGHY